MRMSQVLVKLELIVAHKIHATNQSVLCDPVVRYAKYENACRIVDAYLAALIKCTQVEPCES